MDLMEYMICGFEKGDKEETPHIQGYVFFKKKKRLSFLKKLWPRGHFEVARGSPQQNYAYCSKDGLFHEHGTLPKGQGSRTDLARVKELVDSGASIDTIRSECYAPFIRYRKALIEDFEAHRPHRNWTTELHIHWGDTGTGKTTGLLTRFPDAYWKPWGDWWDQYEGQEVVIIDEFYGWLPLGMCLRLGCRAPLQVPVKGGFRKFTAKQVFFTSNVPWQQWWPAAPSAKLAAFERRLVDVVHYKQLVKDAS